MAMETECVLNIQLIEHLCPKYVDYCILLCHYAASSANFLPTFQDNLSVPSSGFKKPEPRNPRMEQIGCPEMSVRNYYYLLRNNPEERSSQLLRGGSLK